MQYLEKGKRQALQQTFFKKITKKNFSLRKREIKYHLLLILFSMFNMKGN